MFIEVSVECIAHLEHFFELSTNNGNVGPTRIPQITVLGSVVGEHQCQLTLASESRRKREAMDWRTLALGPSAVCSSDKIRFRAPQKPHVMK